MIVMLEFIPSWVASLVLILMFVWNKLIYLRHEASWQQTLPNRKTYEVSNFTKWLGYGSPIFYLGAYSHLLYSGIMSEPLPSRNSFLAFGISFSSNILLRLSFEHLGSQFGPSGMGLMPSKVVRTWLYRYIRHPIYLANILLFTSIQVAFPGPIAIVSLLGIVLISIFSVIDEERALKNT